MEVADITWEAREDAPGLAEARKKFGDSWFHRMCEGVKLLLTGYFNCFELCNGKQGKSIAPLAGAPASGKLLKVRALVPGQGRSGGIRLAVVVFCKEKRVLIADGWARSADPSDDDFRRAAASARR